jgi:hypothetical protein
LPIPKRIVQNPDVGRAVLFEHERSDDGSWNLPLNELSVFSEYRGNRKTVDFAPAIPILDAEQQKNRTRIGGDRNGIHDTDFGDPTGLPAKPTPRLQNFGQDSHQVCCSVSF